MMIFVRAFDGLHDLIRQCLIYNQAERPDVLTIAQDPYLTMYNWIRNYFPQCIIPASSVRNCPSCNPARRDSC